MTAAVAISGARAPRFAFEGFLPREGKARRRILRDLTAEKRALVFFEGPHRLFATLTDMAAILGGDRPVAAAPSLPKGPALRRRQRLPGFAGALESRAIRDSRRRHRCRSNRFL